MRKLIIILLGVFMFAGLFAITSPQPAPAGFDLAIPNNDDFTQEQRDILVSELKDSGAWDDPELVDHPGEIEDRESWMADEGWDAEVNGEQVTLYPFGGMAYVWEAK